MRTNTKTDAVHRTLIPFMSCIAIALLVSGCASHRFVRNESESTRAELGQAIDDLSTGVEQVQGDVEQLEAGLEEQGGEIEALSETAQQALDRAIAAGKLAEGKFLYETILADDAVQFGFEQATLSGEARQALDRFAEELKENNADVYIEIQGHTDSSGEESYNLLLGEQRSESVRRYLSLEHGLALHRMAVISYGETAPIAEDSTREGRARNRRVALVVLR